MRIGKKMAKFTILVRNNLTKKHKSIVFDSNQTEEEVLDLIKKFIIKYIEENTTEE